MAKRKSAATKKTTPQKKSGLKKSSTKVLTAVVKTTKKTAAKAPKKKAKNKPARKKTETLMCFLTTACVDYYSLPDNCYELNTLRNYRDTYLASNEKGKKLIQDYYRVSPKIVECINNDAGKKNVYMYIYSQVKISCAAIETKKLLFAKKTYSNMVNTLMKKYRLS